MLLERFRGFLDTLWYQMSLLAHVDGLRPMSHSQHRITWLGLYLL